MLSLSISFLRLACVERIILNDNADGSACPKQKKTKKMRTNHILLQTSLWKPLRLAERVGGRFEFLLNRQNDRNIRSISTDVRCPYDVYTHLFARSIMFVMELNAARDTDISNE